MNATIDVRVRERVSGAHPHRKQVFGLLLCVCCAVLALSACRVKNVGPGDSDYPEKNSHPARVIHLKGELPESMPLRIDVSYQAELGGLGDTSDCSFYPSERGPSPFSIEEPVKITRLNDSYVADIFPDKFSPGRCGWTLSGILYWVEASVTNGSQRQDADAYVTADKRQMIDPQALYGNLQRDIWCVKGRSGGDASRTYVCIPDLMNTSGKNRSEIQTQPLRDSARKTLQITSDTKSITINIHARDSYLPNFSKDGEPK